MKPINLPQLGAGYWVTLASASVFGTNTGDIMSHTLQLGNYQGLPFLLIAFLVVLLTERKSPVATTVFYWLAVILLRTAATNLADLGTLQWELDYWAIILVLAIMLVAIVVAAHLTGVVGTTGQDPGLRGKPPTTTMYWLGMLAAATLGTALGDFGAHLVTLRVFAVLSCALFLAAFWMVQGLRSVTPLYWFAIVVFRCAGTNVGDLLAFRRGINLGLPTSTLLTGAVFLACVVVTDRGARTSRHASLAAV